MFQASEEAAVDRPNAAVERKKSPKKRRIPTPRDLSGMVTRGVHGGLDGVHTAMVGARRMGLWMITALALGVAVLGLSGYAAVEAPAPMRVSDFRVEFGDRGPQVAKREIGIWLKRFSYLDKVMAGDAWALDQLSAYLTNLPAVASIERIGTVHEPTDTGPIQRHLVLGLTLREPEMPAILATNERAWIDADGRILPRSLPGPDRRRPILRAIERGGLPALREALTLWRTLEPVMPPDLVTDIVLDEPLDATGTQRGIVLYTRPGTKLIWGSPDDTKYGVTCDDKANALVRTIRCQGDLRRIERINVRFRQPFFILRGSDTPTPGTDAAPRSDLAPSVSPAPSA
jgi:hypothetical protein